ncbi:DUF3830 family protein [Sneathiella aquimaris]|uniref:DUF3830 family protein n=1 Tax=Sneathiella aquimaris TaxID=2599305 RepID=UPI00146BA84B|nr:DUF3830 family protein [Sneathiella aquimaris]
MPVQSDDWYWEKTWSDFRRGNQKIRLKWDHGEAIANFYNEGVPKTAETIRTHFPFELPMVHVAWSGDMVMSAKPHPVGITNPEHHVRLVRPGDVAYDPKYGEFTVTYGTAEARLPSGPNTLVVFAQICEGLEDLAIWARGRRFEGVGSLHFELLS